MNKVNVAKKAKHWSTRERERARSEAIYFCYCCDLLELHKCTFCLDSSPMVRWLIPSVDDAGASITCRSSSEETQIQGEKEREREREREGGRMSKCPSPLSELPFPADGLFINENYWTIGPIVTWAVSYSCWPSFWLALYWLPLSLSLYSTLCTSLPFYPSSSQW